MGGPDSAAPFVAAALGPGSGDFRWLRAHRGAIAVAGLLAFAGPMTFFTGALSVMQAPTADEVARLGLWWTLYGLSMWCLMLFAGYGCERLGTRIAGPLRWALCALAALAVAVVASLLTAGRSAILLEQGLVRSEATMHLNGITVSLVMVLLFFAHLRRSRVQAQAMLRLRAAQTAQRKAQLRIAQARLQEVQARIDPQLLFEMLAALRRLYEQDTARAERFLEGLIELLRAALPRLRAPTSSLLREVDLAHSCVRLRALAGAHTTAMTTEIEPACLHARFPPGVLLPLLGTAAVGAGPCRLQASLANGRCRVRLALPASPPGTTLAQVRSLLTELYGADGSLRVERMAAATDIVVEVPYALA